MTHAGQLALLRRLHVHPMPYENFIRAAIDPVKIGADLPEPRAPDHPWVPDLLPPAPGRR